jgi:hypothetical protein
MSTIEPANIRNMIDNLTKNGMIAPNVSCDMVATSVVSISGISAFLMDGKKLLFIRKCL